jgi:hypothetical protein
MAPTSTPPASTESQVEPRALAEQHLLTGIRAIREIFGRYFDQNWFVSLLDEVPLDQRTLRDVRALSRFTSLFPGDEMEIAHGIGELERLQVALRHYLLPHIKEKLQVSGLSSARTIRDQNQYILRRCVAMTFAHNLGELELLTTRLRRAFEAHTPGLLAPPT